MPRHCTVCANSEKVEIARQMIAAGEPDAAIAARLGVGKMSVWRHRHEHVLKPARAIIAAAGKDADERQKREQLIEHAEKGDLDPSAYLALGAIVADLRRTAERLDRTAEKAEQNGEHTAVAALSGQALRAVEARARLGNHGGFGKPVVQGGGEGAPVFQISFQFTSRPPETVGFSGGPVIEGEARVPEGGQAQPGDGAPGPTTGRLVMPELMPLPAMPVEPRPDFGRIARALGAVAPVVEDGEDDLDEG